MNFSFNGSMMIDLNRFRNLASLPRAGCFPVMNKLVPVTKPATFMRLWWAVALVLPAFGTQAAVILTRIHAFEVYTNGANPMPGSSRAAMATSMAPLTAAVKAEPGPFSG